MNAKWLSPERFLALGFASVILLGTLLLLLPISANPGVTIRPLDALFTSTSAVCVTGLVVMDTADSFSIFGRTVVALMIQIGGLGISAVGVTFILLAGKKVGLKERVLIKESLNLGSLKGIVKLIKSIVMMTLCFEGAGLILSYVVFSQDYPPLSALGISAFHSVSSFNNAGFDILGGYQSLTSYQDHVLLNLTTCALIIFGGLGFYAIREILNKRSWTNLSMNTKIVLSMTFFLLALGTVLLKLTNNITWLGAFFQSTSARTAGFNTYSIGGLSSAGQFIMILLMFVGASPGSTGGGIKTTTAFTLIKSLFSYATNRDCTAFRRRISQESVFKAFIVASLAIFTICTITLLLCITEPDLSFSQILFEVVSGFGTVGLSTGITPQLKDISKFLLCLIMFIGRLGPLTMACVWVYQPSSNLSYGEERITIG